MVETAGIVENYTTALADRDVDRATELYASDAVVVRYEGVANGADEIRAFLVGFVAGYECFDLVSIDQIRRSDDVIVWDATTETGNGLLQTTNVFVLDDKGLIARHVPLARGFWGKP